MIDKHTKNWEIERIANMDMLLMEMALAEILYIPNVPVKASLNEYIDISKEYSTPNSKVFVNGVPQEQGRDYELVGRELHFDRPLEKERLSKGKWTAIFFGLWGYYGKNDSVDVQYRVGGRETVATGLEIIPPEG